MSTVSNNPPTITFKADEPFALAFEIRGLQAGAQGYTVKSQISDGQSVVHTFVNPAWRGDATDPKRFLIAIETITFIEAGVQKSTAGIHLQAVTTGWPTNKRLRQDLLVFDADSAVVFRTEMFQVLIEPGVTAR